MVPRTTGEVTETTTGGKEREEVGVVTTTKTMVVKETGAEKRKTKEGEGEEGEKDSKLSKIPILL